MKRIFSFFAVFFIAFTGLSSLELPASESEAAPITFRAFARTYNPDGCVYSNNIEAELTIQTTQKQMIGELVATADLHASYARNFSDSWFSVDEAFDFTAYLTHERNYLYMINKKLTISSRGSFNYDKLRFKVLHTQQNKASKLPSKDQRYFYVIDFSGLTPTCDPMDYEFTELPVSVQCMDVEGEEACELP